MMNRILIASLMGASAFAVRVGESFSQSYSFSSSSFTDASGRTVTDMSEDGASWGMGNDGMVLFDNSFHNHDGQDSDLMGRETSKQVIDLTAGDDIDEEGIVMARNSMTVLLVECDALGEFWWDVDHSLEDGLYRVEVDDSESMWSSMNIWDGLFEDEDATCEIMIQAGD